MQPGQTSRSTAILDWHTVYDDCAHYSLYSLNTKATKLSKILPAQQLLSDKRILSAARQKKMREKERIE